MITTIKIFHLLLELHLLAQRQLVMRTICNTTDAVYDRSAGMNGSVTLELLPNPGRKNYTLCRIAGIIDTSIAELNSQYTHNQTCW